MTRKAFAALVAAQNNHVVEALQMGGDFPDCTEKHSCSQDWQSILTEEVSSLFEQLRFDTSDEHIEQAVRLRLARIVVICERWNANLHHL